MGKRSRRRRASGDQLGALEIEPVVHEGLALRPVLSPSSRRAYAELPAGDREDAWHRRVEFLWERLAVSWEIDGVEWSGDELLPRFRAASSEERAWVRARLRAHVAEHFPELDAP